MMVLVIQWAVVHYSETAATLYRAKELHKERAETQAFTFSPLGVAAFYRSSCLVQFYDSMLLSA